MAEWWTICYLFCVCMADAIRPWRRRSIAVNSRSAQPAPHARCDRARLPCRSQWRRNVWDGLKIFTQFNGARSAAAAQLPLPRRGGVVNSSVMTVYQLRAQQQQQQQPQNNHTSVTTTSTPSRATELSSHGSWSQWRALRGYVRNGDKLTSMYLCGHLEIPILDSSYYDDRKILLSPCQL